MVILSTCIWHLGHLLDVFLNCSKSIIMVDAAHCKEKYKGIMLVAMSIDANKQIYPIAFRLGDKKNDDNGCGS